MGSIPISSISSVWCNALTRLPSKQMIRVQFPVRALRVALERFHDGLIRHVYGFESRTRYTGFTLCRVIPTGEVRHSYGVVAQQGEQLLCKQKVAGSIPVSSISENNIYTGLFLSTAIMSKGER